jgi:hypothetical protein
VEDALSEGVLADRFREGDTVILYIQDGELAFRPEEANDNLSVAEMENGEPPPRLETVLS